jgi:hypothetical protein
MKWGWKNGGIQVPVVVANQGIPVCHYLPVLPKRLLNLLDIGELIENTGVDEPRDVD